MSPQIRRVALICLVVVLLFAVPMAKAAGAWAPNVPYKVGDQVMYNGSLYECIQAHTSLTGWEPPNVPALWKFIGASQPTNTPSGPTATATRTATPTRTPTAAPTQAPSNTPVATATPSGSSCTAPTWSSSAIYTTDNIVSWASKQWRAKWWTQGEEPGTTGQWGVWADLGVCGPVSPTPTSQPLPTNTPWPSATPGGSGIPARVFAVYSDISFTSIQSAYQATGQKYHAISFILGKGGACQPAWDGTRLMSENYYAGEINTVRAGGGDVIVVFGGANGHELASVCPTVSSLQAAYQAVINQYQIKWIDLNVEGTLIADSVSIDRRNKAVKALQDANPGLVVSYTLPVMQTGLLQNALDLLSNARTNGVRVDYVNIMTMNYGPAGIDMGQAAIDAATNTRNQLVGIGLSSTRIGITPMIGQNNTYGEIFDLGDADQLIAFAKANNYVGWLSFWSLGRDNGGCPGQTSASASCSGIAQSNYAFTIKFQAFP
jgi:chitinase